jgi:hypothetical protein
VSIIEAADFRQWPPGRRGFVILILSSVSSGFRRQVLEMNKVGSFKYLRVHTTLLSVI